MTRKSFSGREVAKVLISWGFVPTGGDGSHRNFRYENPNDPDDVRNVTVPMHKRIDEGTLRSIMKQAGGDDFHTFCRTLDKKL